MKTPRRAVEKMQWLLEKRRIARAASAPQQEPAGLALDAKVRLYRQFVSRGDLVFDIGANVGNRVEAFLALHARVIAVEPLPECAAHLREAFGPSCVVVEKGLGAIAGTAELRRGTQDVLASMSEEWIEVTRASGRFDESWDDVLTVEITTLDTLVAQHGMPRFTKIDVEGFEPEVIAGLSSPLPALSIEYACEVADHARTCIDHLESLAQYEYAFSYGESMVLEPWMGPDEILPWIAARAEHSLDWGDIYARTGQT